MLVLFETAAGFALFKVLQSKLESCEVRQIGGMQTAAVCLHVACSAVNFRMWQRTLLR
jgi:hypothetical protein